MVDILAAVPLSLGGIIATLINALLAFVVIIIVHKAIAHSLNAKHALIMAIIALFLTPVVAAFALEAVALPALVGAYIIPLVVWIILGELLLKEGMMTKLKVTVVSFVVYIILSLFVAPSIFSLLPF